MYGIKLSVLYNWSLKKYCYPLPPSPLNTMLKLSRNRPFPSTDLGPLFQNESFIWKLDLYVSKWACRWNTMNGFTWRLVFVQRQRQGTSFQLCMCGGGGGNRLGRWSCIRVMWLFDWPVCKASKEQICPKTFLHYCTCSLLPEFVKTGCIWSRKMEWYNLYTYTIGTIYNLETVLAW